MSDRRTLVERVKACGSFFFEPDTMRFFKSRLHNVYPSYGNNVTYFVTSERGPNDRRSYTVRKFMNCDVKTVGYHGQYLDASDARAAARQLARGPKRPKQKTLF